MTKINKNTIDSVRDLFIRGTRYISGIKLKVAQLVSGIETQRLARNYQVERVLRWYEKQGDALVGEKVLSNIELSELQQLFDQPLDNLMYECYLVTDEQVNYLQERLNQTFDLQSYEYFVDCDVVCELNQPSN